MCRHLGHNDGFQPTYRGFQSWLGLPYSGDMGCIDTTPQGCKPSYNRSIRQASCPAFCPLDVPDTDVAVGTPPNCSSYSSHPGCPSFEDPVAIPLFNSSSPNCSGHPRCEQDIVQQPYDPFGLNHHYAQRAADILARFKPGSGADAGNPFLLYVAFAHTHTPLAYQKKFENASTRPGYHKVFGNTLAEVDNAVGAIMASLQSNGLAEDTLVMLTADK